MDCAMCFRYRLVLDDHWSLCLNWDININKIVNRSYRHWLGNKTHMVYYAQVARSRGEICRSWSL